MNNSCPECNGKCCRDELGYKIVHMAAECYEHICDLCYDGTDYNISLFEFRDLKDQIKKLKSEKDGAYSERNKLVSLISKIFPSSLGRHEDSDTSWNDDWRWIVYVNIPTGQCSWHIHDDDLPMFSHLKRENVKWDGHTTEEKYDRISRFKELVEEGQVLRRNFDAATSGMRNITEEDLKRKS